MVRARAVNRRWSGAFGWSSAYPMAALTVSSTATRRGLDNQPASETHRRHLSMLSDFLARLPFGGTVTSGYRSPAVNAAVGGSATSQHPNGLAVDIVPSTMSNRDAASLLFERRASFPELDQVIWYTDTNHVHIGICPPGASGCPSPRGLFLQAKKEGSSYAAWTPEIVSTAATMLYNAPMVVTVNDVRRRRPWIVPAAFGSAGLLVFVLLVAIGVRR
jgi:zinc D-Ala-D-Ala carboxypeptidase